MNTMREHTIYKALSEEIRVRIMILLTAGELCVCDLTEVISLPQPTISRHMSKLKAAGLVEDRRNSRWVFYSLQPQQDSFVQQIFGSLRACAEREPYKSDLETLQQYKQIKKKPDCTGQVYD